MDRKQVKERIFDLEDKLIDLNSELLDLMPVDSDINIKDLISIDDINYDKIYQFIKERCDEGYYDIIYCSNAMEYLSKNDDSLTESIDYAEYLGYTMDDINSEILASVHKHMSILAYLEDNNTKIESVCTKINDCIDEIKELTEIL